MPGKNRVIGVLLLSMVLVSCAGMGTGDRVKWVSYKTLISTNLANVSKLSVGMTKTQVLSTMGNLAASTKDTLVPNPYTVETFRVGRSQYEVMYYMTQKYRPFTSIRLSQATPVVLREGVVVGWGSNVLFDAEEGRYEPNR